MSIGVSETWWTTFRMVTDDRTGRNGDLEARHLGLVTTTAVVLATGRLRLSQEG